MTTKQNLLNTELAVMVTDAIPNLNLFLTNNHGDLSEWQNFGMAAPHNGRPTLFSHTIVCDGCAVTQ